MKRIKISSLSDNIDAKDLEKDLKLGVNVKNIIPENDSYIVEYKNNKDRGRKQKIPKDEVIKLKDQGVSCQAIANQFNCSRTYIYMVIKEKERKEKEKNDKNSSI